MPVKFSKSSRLVKSTLWVDWVGPRDDMKRVEVSGVCRLSTAAEGEAWRGREGAEWGGRPPLAMHTPLHVENTPSYDIVQYHVHCLMCALCSLASLFLLYIDKKWTNRHTGYKTGIAPVWQHSSGFAHIKHATPLLVINL